MKIKRRGDRQGTHRITLSFSQDIYEALRDQSAKEDGYSIAGVARRVIDRALTCGLLDADTPTSPQGALVVRGALLEQRHQLVDKLQQAHDKQIEGLQERLDIKDLLFAQMKRALEEYTEIITDQATTILTLQDALRELDGPFVVRDAGSGES